MDLQINMRYHYDNLRYNIAKNNIAHSSLFEIQNEMTRCVDYQYLTRLFDSNHAPAFDIA